MKYFVFIFFMLICFSAASNESKHEKMGIDQVGEIKVNVTKLRNSVGNINALLFNNETGYPESSNLAYRVQSVSVGDLEADIVFKNIPHGDYVITVFHDEDKDGKLARHWYGPPSEGVGVSNNNPGFFGPPDYSKSIIRFNQISFQVNITLIYE